MRHRGPRSLGSLEVTGNGVPPRVVFTQWYQSGIKKPFIDRPRLSQINYSAYLSGLKRADERTRTADLLITSERSGVAGVCSGLQFPHI